MKATESIKVTPELHTIINAYKQKESNNDFIHRAVIYYLENSNDVHIHKHKIIKAMILEEPGEMAGQIAVDIQTVDFNGKEMGRNWAIYDSIEEARNDQLPLTKGLEVFDKLKD